MEQKLSDLLLKLRSIPHLTLPIEIDAVRLRQELESIPFPLLPYQSNFQEAHNHYQTYWKGLSLVSKDGGIFTDLCEGELADTIGTYQKTGLSDYCPYAYEILDMIGAGESRARILAIQPGGTLGWHSHVLELNQPEHLIVFQIPVVMPEKFKYSVISYMEYRGSDFSELPKVYEAHYNPGQVYLFNSYHYHNVFNHSSDETRLTVMCYVSLKNPKVFDVVQRAVDSYNGDLIETYDSYVDKMKRKLNINENSNTG